MTISTEQLAVLQHALGLDQFGRVDDSTGSPVRRYSGGKTYRNHYVTGDDDTNCRALVSLGLMRRHAPREISGGDPIFTVTELGKQYVAAHSPRAPKISRNAARYDQWLRVSDVYNISFHEWLKRGMYKPTVEQTW